MAPDSIPNVGPQFLPRIRLGHDGVGCVEERLVGAQGLGNVEGVGGHAAKKRVPLCHIVTEWGGLLQATVVYDVVVHLEVGDIEGTMENH